MNSQKIRFNCSSCGIRLDVPAALAGISGPCPSCQATITAPQPEAAPPAPAEPTLQNPPVREELSAQPTPQPATQPGPPAEPMPAPPVRPQPVQPTQPQQPQQQQPQQQANVPEQNVFPTVVPSPERQVHPTPDDLPFTVQPQPVSPATTNEGTAQPENEQRRMGGSTTPTKQKSRIPSLLFILAFMVIATCVLLFLLNAMGIVGLNNFKSLFGPSSAEPAPAPLTNTITTAPAAPTPAEPTVEASPEPTSSFIPTPAPSPAGEPESTTPAELPAPPPEPRIPEGENFREGQTPLPEVLAQNMANAADPEVVQQTLESFLAAPTLEARKPLSALKSLQEHAVVDSALNGKLPPASAPVFLSVFNDAAEGRRDFFYAIAFDGKKNTPQNPITVELHGWEAGDHPKVHVKAFLEIYENKLAQFASSPDNPPAQFFTIAKCVSSCFEAQTVPNHSNKATLKLGTLPNLLTVTKAYFTKSGEILDNLKKHDKGHAFKEGIPMTVTLQWNLEVKEKPFIELIQINSFDWHP